MNRIWLLLLAIAVDALQILVTPLFATGAGLFLDPLIDCTMCLIMSAVRGFHWVFLPTFLAELVPGVDLAPFWTLAAILTWKSERRKPIEMKTVQEAAPTPPRLPDGPVER